jgi:hypothetical protein
MGFILMVLTVKPGRCSISCGVANMMTFNIVLWRARTETPLTLTQVEASSVLQAVFLLMQQHQVAVAYQVQVLFSDGATWNAYHVQCPQGPASPLDPLVPRSMRRYDVALWRRGTVNELPLVNEYIVAASPLLAALAAMNLRNLRFVARVAVGCPDRSIWRHDRLGLALDQEGSMLHD